MTQPAEDDKQRAALDAFTEGLDTALWAWEQDEITGRRDALLAELAD